MNIINRNQVLDFVTRNGFNLQYVSLEFQNENHEIVLAAVNNIGLALEYASPELQNDREIVLAAVNNIALSLEFASPELQNDREIVLTAIKQNSYALQYVDQNLHNYWNNKKNYLLSRDISNNILNEYFTKSITKFL